MNRIDTTFASLASANRKALVAAKIRELRDGMDSQQHA